MKLTADQSKALKAIDKWEKSKDRSKFTMGGFAGSGKTTILGEYIRGLPPGSYHCCAPTGKAASVLRSKLGKITVLTCHQVLYTPVGAGVAKLADLEAQLLQAKSDEQPIAALMIAIRKEKERLAEEEVRFQLKTNPELEGKLVIIDEASMVSERMCGDFERAGARCLFVGDPGQLPPVKDASWFIEHKHNVMLDKVLRQAQESPIIRLSMAIRNGDVDMSQYKDMPCAILPKEAVAPEAWMKADQVITGSNSSRRRINRFFRKRLGHIQFSQLPVASDKLICLKNDHYQLPEPWINGVQFYAREAVMDPGDGIYWLDCDYGGFPQRVELYPQHLQENYQEGVEHDPSEMRKGMMEADYAYAITCHKSQGSEWPYVIVADDKMQFDNKAFRRRWLYTAVTRAKESLLIVQ